MHHTDSRPAVPELKLPRRASTVSENSNTNADGGLAAEFEALRERETNLRAYEERLRVWQTQLDARSGGAPAPGLTAAPFARSSSHAPFAQDPALEAAWDKLYRARALLDAEQNQLCDERLKFREALAALDEREALLIDREARVAVRERQLAAAPAPAPAPAEPPPASGAWNLTSAPFRAARSLFRSGS